jgi:hypothetical protein
MMMMMMIILLLNRYGHKPIYKLYSVVEIGTSLRSEPH